MPVVYIDILFAENLIIDYLLILCSVKISPCESGKTRIFVSALIGALYSVVAVFYPVFTGNCVVGFAVSFAIVYIAFAPRSLHGFYKSTAYFYGVCFVFSGFINLLIFATDFAAVSDAVFLKGSVYMPFSTFKVLMFAGLCAFAVLKGFAVIKRMFLQSDSFCRVSITCGKKTVTADGFVDTGNMLFDSSTNLPVMVMDKSLVPKLFDCRLSELIVQKDIASVYEFYGEFNWRLVSYTAVSGEGVMIAFMPDKISICSKNLPCISTKCLVAISDRYIRADGCRFIINPDCLKKG